jgi:hypothetical protein
MGRATSLRPDWEHVNIAAMDFFLRQKWVPGTPEFDQLLRQAYPIVEFNNWGDRRFGAMIDNGRGRNALGLLLALIVIEYHNGGIEPGAPEERWAERQVELIARMYALPDYGIVFGQPPQISHPPAPASLPTDQVETNQRGGGRQLRLFLPITLENAPSTIASPQSRETTYQTRQGRAEHRNAASRLRAMQDDSGRFWAKATSLCRRMSSQVERSADRSYLGPITPGTFQIPG